MSSIGTEDISNNLLVFPDITRIHSDPETEHIPSDISILQDTFFVLINYVTSTDSKSIRINELIGRTDITPVIQELSKYEIFLICHHILELNKSILDQELRAELKESLNKYFISPWQRFTFSISTSIQELHHLELQYKFKEQNLQSWQKFITLLKNQNSYLGDNLDRGLRSQSLQFLTISQALDSLLELKERIGKEQFNSQYLILKEEIEELLIDLAHKNEDNIHVRTAVMFHLLYSYIDKDVENLSSTQDILDNLWKDYRSYENDHHDLNVLFFAFYSIIIERFIQQSPDFTLQRNLIQTIISRYNSDIEGASNVVNTLFNAGAIHPWVFDKLVQGFDSYTTILFNFLQCLPSCQQKSDLLSHLDKATDYCYTLVINHIVNQNNYTHPENNVDDFLDGFSDISLPKLYKKSITDFIINTNRILLFIKRERMYNPQYQYRLDLWLKCLKFSNNQELIFLFEIDILLLTGQYPFQPILEMIKAEISENKSILTSTTFEERIIKVITQSLESLSKSYQHSSVVNEQAYLSLLTFTGEWLQFFSQDKNLFSEAHGALSAVIIICFSHLSQFYYRRKATEKAFLMYLNLYLFSEYLTYIIYSMNIPKSSSRSVMDEILHKFQSISKEWNFESIIDFEFIKNGAKKIELQLKYNLEPNHSQPTLSGMIDDDLLFAYLDLNDALKKFLENDMRSLTGDALLDLYNFEVFSLPDEHSLSRLSHIGSSLINSQESSHKPLPFPFLKEIDQLVVAMTITQFQYDKDDLRDNALIGSIKDLLQLE